MKKIKQWSFNAIFFAMKKPKNVIIPSLEIAEKSLKLRTKAIKFKKNV